MNAKGTSIGGKLFFLAWQVPLHLFSSRLESRISGNMPSRSTGGQQCSSSCQAELQLQAFIFSERRWKVHFDSLPTSAAGCGAMNVRACMKIDSTRMATRRQRSDVGCHACRRQFCHLQHAVSATRLSSVRSSYTTSSRLNFRRVLGMHLAKPVE